MDYKRVCRQAEKQHRKYLTDNLLSVGTRDPLSFWKIINKMNNWGKEQTDETEHIKPATWAKYFTTLLNKKDNKSKTIFTSNTVLDSHIQGINMTFDPTLDRRITAEELRLALGQLKGKKAPGPDGILTEYLRIFGETFEDLLLTIIRQLFSKHVYPSHWNSNYLRPIYKRGYGRP